jgi:predicted nucleic acid-binding protein
MTIVIDSSITVAWLYEDERDAGVENIFGIVQRQDAWVPAIWPLEVANALQFGIRRGRIDAAYRDGALADLAVLAINIDPETSAFAWNDTLALAERFRLTLYDACYLELALRRALPLATLDRDLHAAAVSLGVAMTEG